jgi:orotidine-5'-phosphate decarboxylase
MPFRPMSAAGAALYLLLAGPSLASPCTDRINALETRVKEAAEATASVSSGGQGVAAARESQAMQARNQGAPIAAPTVPPFQNEAREAQTTRQAAEAGGGGDRVIQARATLNQARTLDERGDGAACLDTVAQAERQLGSR